MLGADVPRTRGEVASFKTQELQASLRGLLSRWCLCHQTRYRQGLNEVDLSKIAPARIICFSSPALPVQHLYPTLFYFPLISYFLLDRLEAPKLNRCLVFLLCPYSRS